MTPPKAPIRSSPVSLLSLGWDQRPVNSHQSQVTSDHLPVPCQFGLVSSSSCSRQDCRRLPSATSHYLGLLLSAPTTLIELPMAPWEDWGWLTGGTWDWRFLQVQKCGWRVPQVQKQSGGASSGPGHHADLHQVVLTFISRTSRGSNKQEQSWRSWSFQIPEIFSLLYYFFSLINFVSKASMGEGKKAMGRLFQLDCGKHRRNLHQVIHILIWHFRTSKGSDKGEHSWIS